MLRRWLIALGVVYLAIAAALVATRTGLGVGRDHRRTPLRRSRLSSPSGPRAGEHFVDPASGRLIAVRYNPETG
jgi:hypothetical protein